MQFNLEDNIPGCPNFKWKEAFTSTTYTRNKLVQDFRALSTAEQDEIALNIIKVAQRLQMARDVLGFPISIESWWRSKKLDDRFGGAGNHVRGDAVDPKLSGDRLKAFVKLFKQHSGGLGDGPTKAHIDLGDERRWKYS